MPIVVQYGPISGALSMARKAGAGQGFASQAQRDLEAMQLQNSMQQTANTEANHEIQNGMAYSQLQSQQDLQQQQMAQQSAYKNAELQLAQQAGQSRADQATAIAEDRKRRNDALDALTPDEQKIAQFPSLGLAQGRATGQQDANSRFVADHIDRQIASNENQAAKLEAAAKKLDPIINGQQAIDALMEQAAALRKQTDEVDPATGMSLRQSQQMYRGKLGASAMPPQPQGAAAPVAQTGGISPVAIEEARRIVGNDPQAILQYIKGRKAQPMPPQVAPAQQPVDQGPADMQGMNGFNQF